MLLTFLLSLCWFNIHAASWRVNNNPAVNAHFSTFQAAHDAAEPGDTIYVEGTGLESHYGYNIVITKKLIVIGPGYFLAENDSTHVNKVPARFRDLTLEAGAAGSEIYGLHIEYGTAGNGKLNIKASDVIISRNYFARNNDPIIIGANIQNITITQNYAYRITDAYETSVNNILIANNYITDIITLNNRSNGVIVNNVTFNGIHNVYNSQIKNNIVLNAGQGSPFSQANPGNYINYNLVAGNLPAGNYGPDNQGNIDMSEVFLGYPASGGYSTDGRWQLKSGSPAIAAGEDGIDCGMFGGTLPYVLSGMPPVPRIYEAIVPTAGSSSSGLPVIIKAKSQN